MTISLARRTEKPQDPRSRELQLRAAAESVLLVIGEMNSIISRGDLHILIARTAVSMNVDRKELVAVVVNTLCDAVESELTHGGTGVACVHLGTMH